MSKCSSTWLGGDKIWSSQLILNWHEQKDDLQKGNESEAQGLGKFPTDGGEDDPGELGKRGWRWHRPCQRLPTCLVCIDSHPPRPASCETISGPNQSKPLEAPCLSDICSHWSLSQDLWSLGRRHGKFYFCRCSKREGCHWSDCQK